MSQDNDSLSTPSSTSAVSVKTPPATASSKSPKNASSKTRTEQPSANGLKQPKRFEGKSAASHPLVTDSPITVPRLDVRAILSQIAPVVWENQMTRMMAQVGVIREDPRWTAQQIRRAMTLLLTSDGKPTELAAKAVNRMTVSDPAIVAMGLMRVAVAHLDL